MVQLHNFFFFITSMVVPRGTAAPVLFQWFVSREVPTGVPFSNGTIIPIPISSFPLLVYIHSREFICSMDGVKGGALVKASRPILLPSEMKNAPFCLVPVLHFPLLESKALPSDLTCVESFCGVLCLLFFRTFWSARRRGLEALALPMNMSHGGVCICMLGVLMSNTKKIQFTQRLPLGSELHMGKERCCLRGLDHLHGPTSHSICGNLSFYKPSLRLHNESLRALPTSNGKLEHYMHRWMKNSEHNNFWLTLFPEKRYFRETTSTTEVSIQTNFFTDLYAPIGTPSYRTGGWYTTIMKLPFIFFIWIGFMLASSGGPRSLLRQLQKDKLRWNRESSVEFT